MYLGITHPGWHFFLQSIDSPFLPSLLDIFCTILYFQFLFVLEEYIFFLKFQAFHQIFNFYLTYLKLKHLSRQIKLFFPFRRCGTAIVFYWQVNYFSIILAKWFQIIKLSIFYLGMFIILIFGLLTAFFRNSYHEWYQRFLYIFLSEKQK